jgi:hypothetical protein
MEGDLNTIKQQTNRQKDELQSVKGEVSSINQRDASMDQQIQVIKNNLGQASG